MIVPLIIGIFLWLSWLFIIRTTWILDYHCDTYKKENFPVIFPIIGLTPFMISSRESMWLGVFLNGLGFIALFIWMCVYGEDYPLRSFLKLLISNINGESK